MMEGEYKVEQILAKRVVRGKTFYLIKWVDFQYNDCTWESEESLDACASLVDKFNKEAAKKEERKQRMLEQKPKVGFARGLKPIKISDATKIAGELYFTIRWEAEDEKIVDLVPAKEANEKCPEVVIRFYEERLCWK